MGAARNNAELFRIRAAWAIRAAWMIGVLKSGLTLRRGDYEQRFALRGRRTWARDIATLREAGFILEPLYRGSRGEGGAYRLVCFRAEPEAA